MEGVPYRKAGGLFLRPVCHPGHHKRPRHIGGRRGPYGDAPAVAVDRLLVLPELSVHLNKPARGGKIQALKKKRKRKQSPQMLRETKSSLFVLYKHVQQTTKRTNQ